MILSNKIKIFHWETIKVLFSFWIFGLTNNFGYVVMLSCAHDILEDSKDEENVAIKREYKRKCHVLCTGAVLLADTIPCFVVKLFAPFLPLRIHFRILITILCSAVGMILVALKIHTWSVVFGVVCTSMAEGFGEVSFLSFMPFFKNPNVISTWSSGTGAAGLFGSFTYAGLIALGLTPTTTLLAMLVSPLTMAIFFWLVLPHPRMTIIYPSEGPPLGEIISFKHKLSVIPHLVLHYTAPFSLVFLFEYFINHGLFEVLYFPKTFLDHHDQYRWYQVVYQAGVFFSKSSMNIIEIDYLWALAIIQGLNVIVLLTEVLVGYMHYLTICMCIILWEGLIAGTSYVNTYRRIVTEFPLHEREFSMAMNGFGDSIMITLAGIIAVPLHDVLCRTAPVYK